MTEKFAETLVAIMQEKGLNQTQLARGIGIKPQAVQQWLTKTGKRTVPSPRNIEALANYLGVPPAVLQYGANPPSYVTTTVTLEDGVIAIPQFRACGVCTPDSPASQLTGAFVSTLRVSPEWLAAKAPGVRTDRLEIITARGDSMAPTIKDLDLLIVDKSQRTIEMDGIYAVTFAGTTYVKRIQRQISGGLLLISDNPRYPPMSVTTEELDQIYIEGRIVLCGKIETL